jgi:hypothetical protein
VRGQSASPSAPLPATDVIHRVLLLASLAAPLVVATGQRAAHSRHVGTAVVGDARLDLLAYDDGTVTASAGPITSSAYARWRGDDLRLWLDTAAAVVRYGEATVSGEEVTLSTPIDGIWLVRRVTSTGSSYVLSVISPASAEVLDTRPTTAQLTALLKLLSRADTVMRNMTPDSVLHPPPAPRRAETTVSTRRQSCVSLEGGTCELVGGEVELPPRPAPVAVAKPFPPSVVMQFVVNRGGRPDAGSIRVLRSDDASLNETAKQIVLRTRYPLVVVPEGRPVVQQVQHRIVFRPEGPSSER